MINAAISSTKSAETARARAGIEKNEAGQYPREQKCIEAAIEQLWTESEKLIDSALEKRST